MNNLFCNTESVDEAPLAARMRPQQLGEFLGQKSLVGEGKLLKESIERDTPFSMILWGPPGSGKTTLALIIAHSTNSHFIALSAVSAGVKDLHRASSESLNRLKISKQKTILFIDEIHRFNKSQQDAVLPTVENGTLTLIGATTENPSFEVNGALLSRCRVLRLEALSKDNLAAIIYRALEDRERGLGNQNIIIEPEAVQHLATIAGGDARVALNTLELATMSLPREGEDNNRLTSENIDDALQQRTPNYDKDGDWHYDAISALHKSVRDSDPDGALYWLARMLIAGDDPLYIARRIIRMAVEDIGMAEPFALTIAVSAQQAVHCVGQPEGELVLGHAVVYLATSPKSNAVYSAFSKARQDAQQTSHEPIPLHLRNAPTQLMREMGHGQDYKYAHNYDGAIVDQEHLPEVIRGHQYYKPSNSGREAKIREWMKKIRNKE